MMTLKAHIDGRNIVLDEPLPTSIASGARLKLNVEFVDASTITPVPDVFEPLNIHISSELSNAIAMDPEFNIEES